MIDRHLRISNSVPAFPARVRPGRFSRVEGHGFQPCR